MGIVQSIVQSQKGARISISAKKTLKGLKRGDSIAVNGVCLTATTVSPTGFSADIADQTIAVTDLKNLQRKERVNLERAIRLGHRMDGHWVSGHVDGVGVIRNRKEIENALALTLSVPQSILKYCIPKGSITIDGISLTIQSCLPKGITVMIIPHTAKMTTLGIKMKNASVNLEADLIGKYIERFILKPGRALSR
jgi:riboflavin synthase